MSEAEVRQEMLSFDEFLQLFMRNQEAVVGKKKLKAPNETDKVSKALSEIKFKDQTRDKLLKRLINSDENKRWELQKASIKAVNEIGKPPKKIIRKKGELGYEESLDMMKIQTWLDKQLSADMYH